MAVSLHEKLAPTFVAFEKVGKIADSFNHAKRISNIVEKNNHSLKFNNSVEKLIQLREASSVHHSYLNPIHHPFSSNYKQYKSSYLKFLTTPLALNKTVLIRDFKAEIFNVEDSVLGNNLANNHIDVKISNVIAKIKDVDNINSDSFIDIKETSFYKSLFQQNDYLYKDGDLYYINNFFYNSPPTEDEITEWKKRKKLILTSLLSKLIKIKKEISKSVKNYRVNRRECFRKIYCFFFKNLDDTDSVALISFAY